jgi:hemoglobin-like flavoprotein
MAKPQRVRKQADNLYIKTIKPLTYAQKQMFEAWEEGYNIIASGSAGTGKTFLATYLALKSLFNNKTNTEHVVDAFNKVHEGMVFEVLFIESDKKYEDNEEEIKEGIESRFPGAVIASYQILDAVPSK